MAIPDVQALMLPMLRLAADGQEHALYTLKKLDLDYFTEDADG